MYVWKMFKFREADFLDIFIEYPRREFLDGEWKNFHCQRLRECVVYFIYREGKLSGPFKTTTKSECPERFLDMYINFVNHEILLLEPRQIAQEVFTRKVWFRPAEFDDIERNTIFFEYDKKALLGPWVLPYDLTSYDKEIIQKINKKTLYVVNEQQKFD